jgi:NADH:ubiquinone reductase (H+-translocating)
MRFPVSENVPHRVVVIGGGFAGLYAVRSLKGAPVQITLLDRRNFHLFQPLLYQVATGTLSVGNIAASLRATLRRQKNASVLMGEMTGLDVAKGEVILHDGRLPYDTLIIATGSQPFYFGHDAWSTYAPGLKTIEDATAMRARILRAFESAERETDPDLIRQWLTFVIVGAGPTGVELAGALAEVARRTLRNDFRRINPREAQILLINGLDRALPEYPPELSAKAEHALRRLGVTIRNQTLVTDVLPDGVAIGQERIYAKTVLWAAGVKASPIGRVVADATGTTLQKDGRVNVAADLSLPGHPNIFVIGDLACAQHEGFPRGLPGTAPVAIQEGKYVADVVEARLKSKTIKPFSYFHWGNLATIGRNRAVAEFGRLRFNGFFAWIAWLLIHLFKIIEVEDRLLVFMQWIWSYVSWNRSDLLITYTQPAAPSTSAPVAEKKRVEVPAKAHAE